MVCPPSRADLEEVAVTAGSPRRFHLESAQRVPQATPSAAGQDCPSIRWCERSSLLKNRMQEICTFGSVRGGGGNIPAYSATHYESAMYIKALSLPGLLPLVQRML